MSTEIEREYDESTASLVEVMHIENSSKRRARSEKLASYFLLAVVVLETVSFAMMGSSFSRWFLVVCLCLYTAAWLGRARTYRARLMDLADRHREVLNE